MWSPATRDKAWGQVRQGSTRGEGRERLPVLAPPPSSASGVWWALLWVSGLVGSLGECVVLCGVLGESHHTGQGLGTSGEGSARGKGCERLSTRPSSLPSLWGVVNSPQWLRGNCVCVVHALPLGLVLWTELHPRPFSKLPECMVVSAPQGSLVVIRLSPIP